MKKRIFQCLFLVCSILFVISSAAYAAPVGKITGLEGKVDVLKAGQRTVAGVSLGDNVDVGDIYRAKTNSRAEITFFNKNFLRIHPATRVQISEYSDDGTRSNQIMKMDRGKVEAVSGQEFIRKVSSFAEGNKFEVHTPNAVAGIRGSGMTVGFAQMVTGLFFSTGRGYFYNPSQSGRIVNISAGFVSFIVGTGGLPSRPVPGNVSYVGGTGIAPGTGGTTNTTGSGLTTGINIQTRGFTNPIDQTFTTTPPPPIPDSLLLPEVLLLPDPLVLPPPALPTPALPTLVIPNVVVGMVPSLSGGIGNSETGAAVSFNNVKFYGPSVTGQPQTWQAGSVTGNYWNFHNGNAGFSFIASGGGMSAYVKVSGIDTESNSGVWSANIANGTAPTGVASYTQNFTFSGTASGTFGGVVAGTGAISGIASGVVPSTLTQEAIVTQTILVGMIPYIEGSIGSTDWITVRMNNVKFWGPSTTAQPHTWTSANVTGSYGGNPSYFIGQSFNMTSQGPISNSQMTVNSFSGGSWTGTISNGNAPVGVGTFTLPVGFDGKSTGTYSGSTLSGAASGKAYPGTVIPPS